MKTGVALSGCDIGGAAAFAVLEELEKMGIRPDMVSACSIPSITALLYSAGYSRRASDRLMNRFLQHYRKKGLESALWQFSRSVDIAAHSTKIPFAINTVNAADGKIITFTNDFEVRAKNLESFEFAEPFEPLRATISSLDGRQSHPYGGYTLCDYCSSYGSPVYPLRMNGMEKIISVAFLPAVPRTAQELLVNQVIAGNERSEDCHIALKFGLAPESDIAAYNQAALEQMGEQEEKLYTRLFALA